MAAVGFALHAAAVNLAPITSPLRERGTVIIGTD
jgi:hypothetical protein